MAAGFMADFSKSANEIGAAKMLKAVVWLVVFGVVAYSEFLYLGIVSVLFPGGVAYAACVLGAFTTGISVLCLYAGKSHWFRPGPQLLFSWAFTTVEVIILILNDTLAWAIHNGTTIDQYLSYYRFFVPAVPVVSLVGWGIIMFLDPSRKIRHMRMEMEDKQQEMLLKWEQEKFNAQMEVQYEALGIMKEQLRAEVATNANLSHIQAGAMRATSDAIAQLTGIHPLQQRLKTVDSTHPTEGEGEFPN